MKFQLARPAALPLALSCPDHKRGGSAYDRPIVKRSSTDATPSCLIGDARDADLEVPFRIGDNLGIAGMVRGFNGDYSTTDLRIIFSNILGEFDFGAGRSKDQNLAGIADCVQHPFKEFLAFLGVAAADRVGLVMNMPRRHVGMQDDLIEAGKSRGGRPEPAVIDPGDRSENAALL
jgi:hypothetical protein